MSECVQTFDWYCLFLKCAQFPIDFKSKTADDVRLVMSWPKQNTIHNEN